MVFDSIVSHLLNTFGEYPYLTLNAYNPWALVGDGGSAMDRGLAGSTTRRGSTLSRVRPAPGS